MVDSGKYGVVEKRESKAVEGFSYRLTMREMYALLFKKKKCRRCGSKMERTIKTEFLSDGELHRHPKTIFVPGQVVAVHKTFIKCTGCSEEVSITEFAEDYYDKQR